MNKEYFDTQHIKLSAHGSRKSRFIQVFTWVLFCVFSGFAFSASEESDQRCEALTEQAPTSGNNPQLETVDEILARSEMMYWLGIADGGNQAMFFQGKKMLQEAKTLLANYPENKKANKERQIENLESELESQIDMAHDTMNGVFPLLRYLLGRDTISEWFDEPMVMGPVRATEEFAELVSGFSKRHAQLHVCFAAPTSSDDSSEAASDHPSSVAIENEMTYIFNQDSRFFNHTRSEIREVLTAKEWQQYQTFGMDEAMAKKICQALGITHILEVRIEKLNQADNLWLYQITGRVRSASNGSYNGVIKSFGMVRDNSGKLLWLLAVLILPCLIVVLWIRMLWGSSISLRAVVSFWVGLALSVLAFYFIRSRVSSGDMLVPIAWWSCAMVALLLQLALPLGVFMLLKRNKRLFDWFYGNAERSKSTAMGLGAGLASLIGYAVLVNDHALYAAAYTALAVPTLSIIPVRVTNFLSARPIQKWEDLGSSAIIALVLLSSFLIIPWEDMSLGVIVPLIFAVLLCCLGIYFLYSTSMKMLGQSLTVFIGAIVVFGVVVSGIWWLILPLAVMGLLIRPHEQSAKKQGSEAQSVLLNENKLQNLDGSLAGNWPYLQTANHKKLSDHLDRKNTSESVELVIVFGEKGSGKTRLVKEVEEELKLKMQCYSCQCHSGGEPYDFMKQIFPEESKLIFGETSQLNAINKVAGTLGGFVPGADLISGVLEDNENRGLSSPQEMASWLLTHLFSNFKSSDTQPPLIWIDDAHLLGQEDMEAVEVLVSLATVKNKPLTLVLSGTPQDQKSAGEGSSEENRFSFTPKVPKSIKIKSLSLKWSDQEIQNLLETILDEESAQILLKDEKMSEQTPLAYTYWVASLYSKGFFEKHGEKLCLKDHSAELPISTNLLVNAAECIDKLTKEEIKTLEVAALDGVEFNASCVAKARNISDYEVVAHLEEAEMLHAIKDLPEDLTFQFKNKMLREYFISRLQKPTQNLQSPHFKQRYYIVNKNLAEAYKSLEGEDAHLSEAVYHAKLAGVSFKDTTTQLCLKVAHQSLQKNQFATAIENALLVLQSSSKMLQAGTIFLKACFLKAEPPEKYENTKTSWVHSFLDLIEKQGTHLMQTESDQYALFVCEMARTLWYPSRNKEKPRDADIETSYRILCSLSPEDKTSPSTSIRIYHFLGKSLNLEASRLEGEEKTQKNKEALKWLNQALDIKIQDPCFETNQERAEALNSRASILIDLKEQNQVLQDLQESISLKEINGDLVGQAMSYGAWGRFLLYGKDKTKECLEQAIEKFQIDLEISEKIGDVQGLGMMPSMIAECYLELGDYEQAAKFYQDSLDVAERLGNEISANYARIGLITAKINQGVSEEELTQDWTKLSAQLERASIPYLLQKQKTLYEKILKLYPEVKWIKPINP